MARGRTSGSRSARMIPTSRRHGSSHAVLLVLFSHFNGYNLLTVQLAADLLRDAQGDVAPADRSSAPGGSAAERRARRRQCVGGLRCPRCASAIDMSTASSPLRNLDILQSWRDRRRALRGPLRGEGSCRQSAATRLAMDRLARDRSEASQVGPLRARPASRSRFARVAPRHTPLHAEHDPRRRLRRRHRRRAPRRTSERQR